MREFTVSVHEAGRRLDRVLTKLMPHAPQGEIYKSLRKKRIKCNGKRVTDGALRLCEGDCLAVYCNDEYFAKPKKAKTVFGSAEITVVYEDEHLLVMNKPSGLLSQGTDGEDSLEMRMRAYLAQKGEFDPQSETVFLPSLCHRIDRNTAGLVIGAKDASTLRCMNQKIRNREIRKFYLCETEGTPLPNEGEICGWLKKDEKNRRMIFCETAQRGATPCKTRYRVLKGGKTAWVEAELLSGKTHQIRAGFAHLGYPLVGDVKYGAQKNGGRRFQHLAAYRLMFAFSKEDEELGYLRGREISLAPEECGFDDDLEKGRAQG